MPTEKTPLTSPGPSSFGAAPAVPYYVQDTHRFYSRRRKERQLQCIMFVTIVATFIMALIVTISYSVSHPDVIPPATIVPPTEETPLETSTPANLLKSAGLKSQPLREPGSSKFEELNAAELKAALSAGNAAIAARRLADATAKPLPSPSPDARQRFAVKTSTRADQLALAGLAEIAATRKVESGRSFMGKPTSFGSFLDGGWAPDELCKQEPSPGCPLYAARYRSYDGSCNHRLQRGKAFTPYRRSLPPDYADGIEAPRRGKFANPLPSAREVSLKVHPPSPSSNPAFSVMLAVYGQFLDHDITATAISQGANGSSLSCCPPAENNHPECFPVKVGPGDPVYDVAGKSCMEFVRSAPAAQCKIGPRQQLNQVTAFIDGSTIYGSEEATALELREFAGGRLRMQSTPDKRLLLPASTNPSDGCNRELELTRGRYCFASGDARANENLHLTTMHLLWARQHNRLADQLADINPQWDDDRLFEEARKIVGAQLQHITYREFLPIVIGDSEMDKRNLKPLRAGMRQKNESDLDPAIANHFAAAAFRFAHTLLPGLMKVTDKQQGTSSYVQLHKMLFNPYSLYSKGGVESSITTATSNTIQKTSTHVTSQLTAHLFEDPLSNKTIPCGLDLVSLNIQRGRDHGLAGYTKWREYCGLTKPLKFEDLKDDLDPEALDAISKLYDNVDDVDLYTGALAELPKGDGLLGPTFTCLISDQFVRLQVGDRYWYETADQPGSFTQDQVTELRKTTLARIICDTSDGITEVQAQVMRSIGADNPIISCEDIPQLSLNSWKTEMPLLTLSETEVPATDWLNFKTEVDQTITDIITSIAAKKPPPGSLPADWLSFQNDINSTFTDLRNKFAALHPKVMTNVTLTRNLTAEPEIFDWASLKDEVNNTIQDIMDSINANKPPPGSLPADWLAFRKKINDLILDIRKKFKIIHPKDKTPKPLNIKLKLDDDIPVIDWTEIKNSINTTVMDVVSSINISKPLPGSAPADWFAFKKKIVDSLAGIKNKFAGLHPKPAIPVEKLSDPGDVTTFNWIEFKDQLNKTLNEIIASTIAKKPPSGSTPADWLAFQKQMNDTFAQFVNQFSDLHRKVADNEKVNIKADEPEDFTPEPDVNAETTVNKTITDIINEIKASKPPPGSTEEDWLAFRQKMSDSFAGMKNKYAYLYSKNNNKPIVKLSKAASNPTFDMVAFREDLNKSLSDLVSLIKAKKPAIDSSMADWASYKKEIKASVSKIKDQFAGFKKKELLDQDYILYAAESESTFDWIGWKKQINKTIDSLIEEVKTIPSGDPKWVSFRDSLNKSFMDLKNDVTAMGTVTFKSPKVKLMAIIEEDWLKFKDRINSTIEDALDDIMSNKPAPGDPSWVKYNIYMKSRFAQMHDDIKAIKTEWFEKVKAASEMMMVADSQFPTASSASYLKINMLGTKYQLQIGIAFITIIFSIM